MARVEIDQVVLKTVSGTLTASSTATVYVYTRGTQTPVTVYQTEAGSSTFTQPLSVSNGRIEGWVDSGQSLDLVITDASSTYTQPWEAVAAAGISATPAGLFNVKDYGAVGNGIANDGPALQAALNAAALPGHPDDPGGTVFLPPGRYLYTTALSIPPGVSIRGVGRTSVLKPVGCDGLVFQTSDQIGPQRFEMFYIYGDGGYNYTAVKALGDANNGRVQGITFVDVFISDWKRGFHLRSTHGWRLSHVICINVWTGVYIAGQTLLLTIDGGSKFVLGRATGTGDSTGIYIDAGFDYVNPGPERGCEGIRMTDTEVFGFAIGIDQQRVLDIDYSHLTIGGTTKIGFRFYVFNGTFALRDSWIAFNTGATRGIQGIGILEDHPDRTPIFENLYFAPEGGQTLAAGSIGMDIGAYQNAVIKNCTFLGFGLHDIRLNWAGRCVVTDNKCTSNCSAASIQLVAKAPPNNYGGPYYLARNWVAKYVQELADNRDRIAPSSSAVTLPPVYDYITITATPGDNVVNFIYVDKGERYGRFVTLRFTDAVTLNDGGNLKLAGTFNATADDTITLVSDGDNWYEVCRSVN